MQHGDGPVEVLLHGGGARGLEVDVPQLLRLVPVPVVGSGEGRGEE
jgi:hypothetical protein